MKQIETRTVEAEVVVDVLCDLCGASTKILKGDANFEDCSYGTLKFSGGYGSAHDMEHVHLELCEKCVFELVDRRKSGKYNADGFAIPAGKTVDEVTGEFYRKFSMEHPIE